MLTIKCRQVCPLLTEENCLKWLMFCLYEVDISVTPHIYVPMYDRVHIDEKWFYICEVNAKYYLLPEEELPPKYVNNKLYIQKIMFLYAVARLCLFPNGQVWDGKIAYGLLPYFLWQFAILLIGKEEQWF